MHAVAKPTGLFRPLSSSLGSPGREADEIRLPDEAGAAGRLRQSGRLPVEGRREFCFLS